MDAFKKGEQLDKVLAESIFIEAIFLTLTCLQTKSRRIFNLVSRK
jgi:hypothetical protein